MCTGVIPVHITMQEILKQKSKNKKPKTFGAVNNAYEIYHLVQVAITEDFMLSQDVIKSERYSEYIRRTKSQLNTLAYNLVVNIIMANVYPNNRTDYEDRVHRQNQAKGLCNAIITIFQLLSREINFNVNRYSYLMKLCYTEYSDIKGWQRVDKRFDKLYNKEGLSLQASATNFANLNNNGNANNNNASYTGIAPAPITRLATPLYSTENTQAPDKERPTILESEVNL